MIEFALQVSNGTFRFRAHCVTIGRDQRCTFVLPDASVMPLHASLVVEDDRLFLRNEDLDSLTFLNRAPLHAKVEVFDGDLIDIGPWTLVVHSRHLARRRQPAGWESEGFTPSDIAIVRTVKLPEPPPIRTSRVDDTSSSFII